MLKELSRAQNDSARIVLLNKLSTDVRSIDPLKSISFSRQSLKLNEENILVSSKAKAYNSIGIAYHYFLNKLDSGEFYYLLSLKTSGTINDSLAIAPTLGNLSYLYSGMGRFDEAIRTAFESLEIHQKKKDMPKEAIQYSNIGKIYVTSGNFKKSIEYFENSIRISSHIKDDYILAEGLNNIAVAYEKKGDPFKAIEYQSKCIGIKEKIDDQRRLPNSYNNLGILYLKIKNFKASENYFQKALSIARSFEDKTGESQNLAGLADLRIEQKRFSEAIELSKTSLEISEKLNLFEGEMHNHDILYLGYSHLKEFEKALFHYKKFVLLSDSINSVAKQKNLNNIEGKYQNDKKTLEIANLEKLGIITKKEIEKQNIQKIALGSGLSFMILIALLILRGYKQKQRANEIILSQKMEVERQKVIMEEKNKEITDSIKYASRIQRALITSERYIEKQLRHHSK